MVRADWIIARVKPSGFAAARPGCYDQVAQSFSGGGQLFIRQIASLFALWVRPLVFEIDLVNLLGQRGGIEQMFDDRGERVVIDAGGADARREVGGLDLNQINKPRFHPPVNPRVTGETLREKKFGVYLVSIFAEHCRE